MQNSFKKPGNILFVIVVILMIIFLLWQNSRIETQMKETALRDGFNVGREID